MTHLRLDRHEIEHTNPLGRVNDGRCPENRMRVDGDMRWLRLLGVGEDVWRRSLAKLLVDVHKTYTIAPVVATFGADRVNTVR